MDSTPPDLRLLGPVQALSLGQPVKLGHARQRSVLAVLLLDANRPVSAASLIERVWGTGPPGASRSTLYSYIARLREALTGAYAAQAPRLRHVTGGYLVEVDENRIDERRARALVAAACASSEPGVAARLFRQARALWRGVPLDGADSPWLVAVRRELEELRARALLGEQEALQRIGRPVELLGDLDRLAVERPLDEAVARAVMRSLALAGRRAEALERFEAHRRALRDDLGVSPDAQTLQMHRELLGPGRKAAPGPAETGRRPAQPASPVPAQLPSGPVAFTGRQAEIRELTAVLAPSAGRRPAPDATASRPGGVSPGTVPHPESATATSRSPAPPPRVLVHGSGGMGKTAVALHVSHRMRARFPDGQIYVNLSGHRPGHQALTSAAVLTRCLRALGVPAADIPPDEEEQASLYRSRLHGRRVLLLLDDAVESAQVLPLVPGDHHTGVLVTSRHRMPELAVHGFHYVEVDALPATQSLQLLRNVVGDERIAAEPKAAVRLCELCAHLPLALRLLAARAADHPMEPLADLAQSLYAGSLLRQLTTEPGSPSPVETAFDLSYRTLNPRLRGLFRLLACLPGADFTTDTAAAAAQEAPDALAAALQRLRSVHLLEEHLSGRYRFHDLVRLYGQQRAAQEDGPATHTAALLRAVRHYHQAADEANVRHRLHLLRPPGSRPQPAPARRFRSTAHAPTPGTLAWLDAEHQNILGAIHAAVAHQLHDPAWRLADAMRGFYRLRPHDPDWQQAAVAGLEAAEATKDCAALAALHLANADIQQARSEEALVLQHAARALTAARSAGWPEGEAAAASGIGVSQWSLGRLRAARGPLRAALRLYRSTGYPAGEAATLGSLGRVHHDLGEWDDAADAYHRSLALSRLLGSRSGQALNLYYLGALRAETGSLRLAVMHLSAAQRLSRAANMHQGDILAAAHLASLLAATGRHTLAVARLPRLADLTDRATDRRAAAEALIHSGDTYRSVGNPHAAFHLHSEALGVARAAHYRRGELLALIALARDHVDAGDTDTAVSAADHALATALNGDPSVHVLRARLTRAEALVAGQPSSEHIALLRDTVRACHRARLHFEATWGVLRLLNAARQVRRVASN